MKNINGNNNKKTRNTKKTEESYRIFAKGCKRTEDTRVSGLNNNVLVCGAPGSGKTGTYVLPTLYSTNNSVVVADTKRTLYRNYAKELRKRGFNVHVLDFVEPEKSEPFNILDGIRRKEKTIRRVVCPGEVDDQGNVLLEEEVMDVTVESYRQQDVQKIVSLLIPNGKHEDRFWIEGSRMVMTSLIAYVLEQLPKEEQHMGSVADLFRQMCNDMADCGSVSFFDELENTDPESFALKKYNLFRTLCKADKTWVCISQFVANALEVFDTEENAAMLCRSGIDLADCGREKTVLFLNLSDCDRSQENIVNALYAQLFQKLIETADENGGHLKVPCHVIIDDFASWYIPDFDLIMAVIRSRGISASIILQSISQLEGLYGKAQASTLCNCCDTMLFMGTQDMATARFFSDKAGMLPESILFLDNDHLWLFTRGEKAKLVEKFKPYAKPEDLEA